LVARSEDVTFTMVDGRVLYHDGRWMGLDVPALRQEVARQLETLA
jgi:hypothetical protein